MPNACSTSESASERILPAFSVFCSLIFFFFGIDMTIRDDVLGSYVLSPHISALHHVMFSMQTCLGTFREAFRFSIVFFSSLCSG